MPPWRGSLGSKSTGTAFSWSAASVQWHRLVRAIFKTPDIGDRPDRDHTAAIMPASILWQLGRRRRRVEVNDARHLRQPVDHALSDEKGQVQRGQPDCEHDQEDIQICGDAVEAAQPFPTSGAVALRWLSQHW